MKRPAFQFYPADWRKDVELRSCSLAARGLWIDILCIAHECEPYGHLTINGKAMNAAQIAGQVGLTKAQCSALLAELTENGVARTNADGVIYSKRMVDDERLRNIRAEAGKLGGNPALLGKKVNQKPTTEVNQKPTPSSSSSSSPSGEKKKAPAAPAVLPEWLPLKAWDDFVEHRKAMRGVPFTDAARAGVLRELEKLKGQGHDPAALLVEAVVRGWRTVFPPKQPFNPADVARVTVPGKPPSTFLADQAEHRRLAEIDRLARLARKEQAA